MFIVDNGREYELTDFLAKPANTPDLQLLNDTGLKCAVCENRSVDSIPLFWRTSDGFELEWPTCGHGKFVLCPEHKDVIMGCPVCGCNSMYT